MYTLKLLNIQTRSSLKLHTTEINFRKFILTAIIFFSVIIQAYSQLYPVQLSQYLTPPYSTSLSSYATTTETKVNVQLLLLDITETHRQVYLKFYLEGNGINVESAPVVSGAPQIFLDGGVPQNLTNVDLSAYFQLENLVGITGQQYSNPLPDGVYTMCWEVYDFNTNQKISKKECLPFYLVLNDPPILNMPQWAEGIVAQNPNFINFQWTPRHVNATNVSYQFELREIWDNNIDPQAAFLASTNLYTESLSGTTLLYDMSKPALVPGKRYAWRVRAISTTGLTENAVFKNNGYSEISYFTFSTNCPPPMYPLSEALSTTKVKLTWQGSPDYYQYHVQYKKMGDENADWEEVYTLNTQVQISNLQAGAVYQFRIGATCEPTSNINPSFTYTNINQFTMPNEDEEATYNCGVTPVITITNTNLLQNLGVNETFTAGDFPVTVKNIQNTGDTFTGYGYIVVPYLSDTKVAVEFKNVKINTDYQLIDGIVETTYDPTWGDMTDVGGNQGDLSMITVDFPINYPSGIQTGPNGNTIIVGPNGNNIDLPGGQSYIITDGSNPPQQYAIDEEGNVTPLGAVATGGAPTPENTAGVSSNGQATDITAAGILVTFSEDSSNKYGFDTYSSSYPDTSEIYSKLGNSYYVPHQSIKKGDDEAYIIANINITDNSIVADSLVFKTQDGTAIEVAQKNGNEWKLKLSGYLDNQVKDVLATIKQGNKYKVAGAFKLHHFEEREVDVILVDTYGANLSNVQEYLNDIYAQGTVKINVVKTITDFTITSQDGTIESGESGFAANYTQQQQAINDDLMSRSDYDSEAYYIILTNLTPTSAESGIMPLGRQFGYIYSGGKHTIAHELGHGAFQLKHPFSAKSYGWPQGSTNWLMDYGSGDAIPFVQWEAIHNPNIHIGIFDDDSEGESFIGAHLTPDWEPFNYEKTHTYLSENTIKQPNGAVFGFVTYDETNLQPTYYEYQVNNSCKCYANSKNNLDMIVPDVIKNPDDSLTIYLYWDTGRCGYSKLYSTKWDYIKDKKGFDVNEVTEFGKVFFVAMVPCNSDDGYFVSDEEYNCFTPGNTDVAVINQKRNEARKLINEMNASNYASILESLTELEACSFVSLNYLEYELLFHKILQYSAQSFNSDEYELLTIIFNNIRPADVELFASYLNQNNVIANFLNKMSQNLNNKEVFDTYYALANRLQNIESWFNKLIYVSDFINKLLSENSILKTEEIIQTFLKNDELENNEIIINEMLKLISQIGDDYTGITNYRHMNNIAKLKLENPQFFKLFTFDKEDISRFLTKGTDQTSFSAGCDIPSSPCVTWLKPIPFKIFYNFSVVHKNVTYNDLKDYFYWSNFLDSNNALNLSYDANIENFIATFDQEFQNYINNSSNDNDIYWQTVNINCNTTYDILDHINTYETVRSLGNVDALKRLALFENYFNCSQSNSNREFYEDQILKLAFSFPTTEGNIINEVDNIGIKKIYDKLSNDSRALFISWLSSQLISSGTAIPPDREDVYDEYGKMKKTFDLVLESDIFNWDNMSTTLLENNTIRVSGMQNGEFMNYKQIVPIYVRTGFTYLGHEFKKGSVQLIPLIQAIPLHNYNTTTALIEATKLGIEVALFIGSAGSANLIANVMNGTITGMQILSTSAQVTNILLDAINDDDLDEQARMELTFYTGLVKYIGLINKFINADSVYSFIVSQVEAKLKGQRKAALMQYLNSIKTQYDAAPTAP